ncbi:cell division ATPase MinD [Thermoproteota archaeon]
MTRFIAISSAKGGVGKTTTAINLGTALSNFGKDVVVLDANITKPNINILLGTPNLSHTIHDVLKGKIHITDAAYIHPSGLRIIPGDISLQVLREIEGWHQHDFKNILIDLVGTTDVVILDTGGGLGTESLSVIKAADELIAVTNPDMPSITDTLKTIRVAEDAGVNVLGVIVNRRSGSPAEVIDRNIEAILEKKILGTIKEDESVGKAVFARQPLVYLYPDSTASIGFKGIAAKLMGQEYVPSISAEKKDFLDKMYERF